MCFIGNKLFNVKGRVVASEIDTDHKLGIKYVASVNVDFDSARLAEVLVSARQYYV